MCHRGLAGASAPRGIKEQSFYSHCAREQAPQKRRGKNILKSIESGKVVSLVY